MLDFIKSIPNYIWVIGIIIITVVFYITTTIKAVRKNQNKLLEVQKEVIVGSEVVLTSGIYGKVLSFDGYTMRLQVDENTTLKVDRFAISKVLTKQEVKEEKKADHKQEKKIEKAEK